MTVGLAIGLTATVLLVRSELDLLHARRGLERAEAEYRLDAIQQLAVRAELGDTDALKLRRIDFEDTSASVEIEAERGKLLPPGAARLPDDWFAALDVASPAALKAQLRGWPKGRPLFMQALADLDPSPLWKACAAQVISAHGAPPGVAAAVRKGELVAAGGVRTLRLRAVADDGWVDDRVVRLSGDAANPVVVLDRRFYRRHGDALACPAAPDFGDLA
jgi:hypothetical protein